MNKELAIVLRALGATQTAREVGKVDSSISRLTSRAGSFASSLKTNVGGAITHLGGRLKGLASAGLGVLGVGGLLSLGGALHEGLDEARAFGDEVIRLGRITGLSVEKTSALASAMHHFGIDAATAMKITGMAEKNLGNLTATSAKAKKFQQDYGFSLLDTSGKVKDFNTLILDSADYFNNKSVPAQKKAAAMAKLYGRGWQDLVPLLSAGRKGIADAEDEAKRFGLTLTADNIDALKKSKDATREWSTALGGLKLQIGLALLPTITDLAKAATGFVSTHRDSIVTFFKNAIAFGRHAASVIGDFAGAVIGFWNSIPAGVRDLLVKGIVADRTMKFLFGISPIQVVAHLAESALGGVGETVAKSLTGTLLGGVQKVWVVNMGVGGVGGPGGAAGAAGKGIKGVLGTAVSAAVLVEALSYVQDNVNMPNAQAQAGKNIQGTEAIIGRGNAGEISSALQGVQASVASLSGLQKVMYDLNANGVKTHTEGLEAALAAALQDALKGTERNLQPLPDNISKKQQKHFNSLRDKIESSRVSTVTRLGSVKSAIDTARINQIAAQRTGDASIVGALRNLSFNFNLTVNGTRQLVRVQSGTTLHRVLSYNGKIVPQA